jgi:hypothetical protein
MAIVVPPAPIENPNFTSYTWVDWYQKVRNAINDASSVSWSNIQGRPTTVVGFGIVDGVYVAANAVVIPTGTNDGTGANSASLNNAPFASDPSKWIEFNDNGVTRYIPAW